MRIRAAVPVILAALAAGVIGASAPGALRAQAPAPPVADRARRVEQGLLPGIVIAGRPSPVKALASRMADLKTPGVSIAVINNGAIEWARGYGVSETGTATAVTPRTLFQAASISKPVAALAALRLVAQGKLALDQDVNERLVGWKVPASDAAKDQKVTLRRLLSHSAGLTVHGFGGYPADAPLPTVQQILDGEKPANSAAVRIDVVPGSLWRYSGGGYTVMQQLLTDATGQPFPALLADLVLGPVGMIDSTYAQPLPGDRRAAAASGHRANGTLLPGRYHTYPEMAAAGLWTTPTDLARFLLEIQRAVRGQSTVLSAALAREMITVQRGSYGLGLSLEGTGPDASFGHGGSNAGFKCQMVAFVEGGRGAVVMTNGDQGGRLAAEVLRAVSAEYGWPSFKPRQKTVVAVDAAALAPLAGRYELRPGRVLTMVVEGASLVVIDGAQRIELFAESATRFFDLVEEHQLDFVKGADGRVIHVLVDGVQPAKRIGD